MVSSPSPSALLQLVAAVIVRPLSATRRYSSSRSSHHQSSSSYLSSSGGGGGNVYCQSNADCLVNLKPAGSGSAPTCHWLYEGCPTGQCMCDPERQKTNPLTGLCIFRRLGGEQCSGGGIDSCPDGMTCTDGRCRCRHDSAEMTTDRQHCLHRRQKLLGQICSPILDTCFHKAVNGYTKNDVECLSGSCQCSSGGRREGSSYSCRNLRLYEHGCSKYHHCEGGATCVDHRCVCPTGYFSRAGDGKCIKNGAVHDLALGAECDEINDRRYCSKGLVCHSCSGVEGSPFHCVRFRLTMAGDLGFLMSGTPTAALHRQTAIVFYWQIMSAFLASVAVVHVMTSSTFQTVCAASVRRPLRQQNCVR